jgi:hypothetical protein
MSDITAGERLFTLASELLRAYREAGPDTDEREPARYREDAAELIERAQHTLDEIRPTLGPSPSDAL